MGNLTSVQQIQLNRSLALPFYVCPVPCPFSNDQDNPPKYRPAIISCREPSIRFLSFHYYIAVTCTYYIFERNEGAKQLCRTQTTTLNGIRKLTAAEYHFLLKKDLQNGSWIFGILVLFLSLLITGVMAQVKSCQLAMCLKNQSTGTVAVAIGDGSSTQFTTIQVALAQQCPGVTNVTFCYVDCKGSYANSGAYWIWEQCTSQSGSYLCNSTTILNLCALGQDPNYPFNTAPTPPIPSIPAIPSIPPTSTYITALISKPSQSKPLQSNSNPSQSNVNSYSQANQVNARLYLISRLLLVITILLCVHLL
ncbi:7775_t:CDS:2 [Dentiscutata erythropus]|uniref:7775_t:CDS:1 n=1 Tax=Dentiscutata erythropus TaxID=1348616 RepID=A0A9N8YSP9_9GLOM|nr:7775_t:CDS:2 [Dentiscutata erythropus]